MVAADVATEIFLIDSSLKRLQSGVGNLKADVQPGFYKVRFRSGASQADVLVDVTGEKPEQTVTGEPVPFWSPAPLTHTLDASPAQAELATAWSRVAPTARGKGGMLFIFLRRMDAQESIDPVGIAILSLDGKEIISLSDGQIDQQAGCAGLNIALDPGTYRLRVSKARLGEYELFVTVSAGWQTQVFLAFEVFTERGKRISAASLRRAAILMVRDGSGFAADDVDARLTELARYALLQGRNAVAGALAAHLGAGALKAPMMALFTAHLLLQERERDWQQHIKSVISELEAQLPVHPDVIALRLAVGDGSSPDARIETIETPPTLAASWQLTTRATRQRAGLIRPESVPGRIAHNLVEGGAWLVHKVPQAAGTPLQAPPLSQSEESLRSMFEMEPDVLAGLLQNQKTSSGALSGLEQNILSLVLAEHRMRELTDLSQDTPSQPRFAQLMRQIQAPAYSISAAVQGLSDKIADLSRDG